MTDWEEHYREGHTPWDKGEPSPALADLLQAGVLSGTILVPGCGLAHDVRAIAEAVPGARVVGLDIAPSAVDAARERGLPEGAEVHQGDLFRLPADWRGTFDWIWEHTCFCAIDPSWRDAYVEAVHGALRPGGRFSGVFFLDPYDDEHRPESARPPFGTSLEEIAERFGGRFTVLTSAVPERAYPGREGRERVILMDRLDG